MVRKAFWVVFFLSIAIVVIDIGIGIYNEPVSASQKIALVCEDTDVYRITLPVGEHQVSVIAPYQYVVVSRESEVGESGHRRIFMSILPPSADTFQLSAEWSTEVIIWTCLETEVAAYSYAQLVEAHYKAGLEQVIVQDLIQWDPVIPPAPPLEDYPI